MIKAIVIDFSRVLLFPNDAGYAGSLNSLHNQLLSKSNYNPFDHFHLNVELLKYLESFKSRIALHIFTSDVIQDDPVFQSFLKPIFHKTFLAKMNIKKDTSNAYEKIVKELGHLPQEVLYIDDNPMNIEAAASAGLSTILYQNNEDLFRSIQLE